MTSGTNRRQFLRTSSIIFTLPFLESMSAGKKVQSNKKLVAINQEFGFYGPSFFPEQSGKNFKEQSEVEYIIPDLCFYVT